VESVANSRQDISAIKVWLLEKVYPFKNLNFFITSLGYQQKTNFFSAYVGGQSRLNIFPQIFMSKIT
jgi:hypothetical protein